MHIIAIIACYRLYKSANIFQIRTFMCNPIGQFNVVRNSKNKDLVVGLTNTNRRRFLTALGGSVGATSLAGCVGSSGDDVVTIGVLSPLSGDWTVYGEAHSRGLELAVQEVNEAGGINGQDVEIDLRDTETLPETVTEQATQLVRSDEVDVVAGTFSSAERNAAAPVVTNAEVPLLYPTFYEGQSQDEFPGVCNELIFKFGPVPSQQVNPWMDYIVSNHGDQFYFIGSDYVWPQETSRRVSEALEDEGGEVVGEEFIPLGTTDFSSAISSITSAEPDVVFGTLTGQDSISFARQFYNQGLNEEITYWTINDEEFATEGKGEDSSAGTYVSFDYFSMIDVDENQEFLSLTREEYGDDAGMNTTGAAMYNIGHMYAEAANAAGTTATDDIIEELEGMTHNGPQGEVHMREEDHQMVLPSYLVQATDSWTGYDDMFEMIDSTGPVEPEDADCNLPLSR